MRRILIAAVLLACDSPFQRPATLARARRRAPLPLPIYRSVIATAFTAAEQFSNTVSVTDPADNKLLGVIRLGDPTAGQFQPAL